MKAKQTVGGNIANFRSDFGKAIGRSERSQSRRSPSIKYPDARQSIPSMANDTCWDKLSTTSFMP
jgi:hypothetical protein